MTISYFKVKSIPGLNVRHDGIDIVIIRENTEGEYRQLEHEVNMKYSSI